MARSGERDAGKERYWRSIMALWRRSRPITVRDFCAEHGLSEPSFYGWRRVLAQRLVGKRAHLRARRQTDPQPAAFVPLRIVPMPSASADLQIVLSSGDVVRVPSAFDAATLRQLLAILKEERSC